MSYILSYLVLQKSLTILDLEVIIPFSVGLLRTIQLLNATFFSRMVFKDVYNRTNRLYFVVILCSDCFYVVHC